MKGCLVSKRMRRIPSGKRGAVTTMTAVSLAVILGFTAFAVDLGHLYVVKCQLQGASDAASMAGVSALIDPAGIAGNMSDTELAAEATARTIEYAEKNRAAGQYVQQNTADIQVGYIADPTNLDESLSTSVSPYNAVRVVARNDVVSLFFAGIWGKTTAPMSATSTAFLDRRASGYRPPADGGPLLPVTVYKQRWLYEVAYGQDNYGYDPETGQTTVGPDGIPEITIYPEKQNKSGAGSAPSDGAGNFGLLDINAYGEGVPVIDEQIRNGLTEEDFLTEFGTPELTFYDDSGNPQSTDIGGTPGLKTTLKEALEFRLGDVVGYFVHSAVVEEGSTATYTIDDIQFGRLLYVDLTGGNKVIVIQPASYTGSGIITDGDAPLHATAGKIRLIR